MCGIDVLHCIVYFCNNYYYICTQMYLLYTSKEVLILRLKVVIVTQTIRATHTDINIAKTIIQLYIEEIHT